MEWNPRQKTKLKCSEARVLLCGIFFYSSARDNLCQNSKKNEKHFFDCFKSEYIELIV